jgi:hypothetical protein
MSARGMFGIQGEICAWITWNVTIGIKMYERGCMVSKEIIGHELIVMWTEIGCNMSYRKHLDMNYLKE